MAKTSARGPRAAAPLTYRIRPQEPTAHLLHVECEIVAPSPAGEILTLPAWIPGSYLIRDFARHVVAVTATVDGRPAGVRKIAKDRWQVKVPAGCRRLVVASRVYAWDLSVRGAHFDTTHAFFNGSSLLFRVEGREGQPCRVELAPPPTPYGRDWRVATALRPERVDARGFGRYAAADYAELIDHPVEMGEFERFDFRAGGVAHAFALSGRHRADLPRLKRDLKRICDWQIDFWGKPAPTDRYLFLTTVTGDGYGGLEHRASTALLCSRDDLPKAGEATVSERYRGFLGLASHEYFHTWLVKRIRPADFDALDLQRENPTEMLWLFEGFTSYYDDLALLRCGLIGAADYLACLARTCGAVIAAPGRRVQSVAEASWDAWIKYYRPDENSPNATVSYYAKGALVALLLDLTLREASRGQASLDDLMRRLWTDFGRSGTGVAEADVRAIAEDLAGKRLGRFFAEALHGTAELPLEKSLARFGVGYETTGGGGPSLGIRLDAGEPKIACAYAGGAAELAGLAGGDVLVAIDGLKVSSGNLDTMLGRRRVGDRVEVHAFRRDELRRFEAVLQPAAPKACSLKLIDKPGALAQRLRQGWLGA